MTLLLMVAGLGLSVGIAVPAQAATVGAVVNVTRSAGNQAEGAIAVDPTNPSRLAAVSNNGDGAGDGMTAAYSTDSGATWTHRTIADGSNGSLPKACCDPSLSWDDFGNLFLVYMDSNADTGGVHVVLSTDGGQNFSVLADLSTGSGADQPTITTGAGSVWVVWTDTSHSNAITTVGAKVTGQGTSGVGSFSATQQAGSGDYGDIAVSPTGAVMVTYQRPQGGSEAGKLYTALDSDGLGSGGFQTEATVVDLHIGAFYPIPAQSSRTIDAEGGLAWDRSGGSHNGRLYYVYTDAPSNSSTDTNVFVKFSDDSGANWSSPVRVNDDSGTNSQFLPRIAVDQTSGKIAVSWHDARNAGSANDTAQLYASTSDAGTAFAANDRVSDGTSNASQAHNGIDYGDYTGLAYDSGSFYPFWADNSNSTGDNPDGANNSFDMYTARVKEGQVTPPPTASTLTYTGATTSDYHDAFTASAVLTAGGSPVSGATVDFTLGSQSCSGTTNSSGTASCSLTPQNVPGSTTITASFAGNSTTSGSTASATFTITKEETSLAYTGPGRIANGTPVHLSGTLTEDDAPPIAGRQVSFVLGTGASQQTCTGTTDAAGHAACTIDKANQPLNDTATVPLTATFEGDAYYRPSSATASLKLEYYTGRAYGLTGKVNLLLTSLTIPPTPDTGAVRTAQATTTNTPCTASVATLLITAHALCPKVTTTLAPGTSTSTTTVKDVSIGIPDVPVIGISGLTASSTSTCTAATGSSTLTLTIAGVPTTVPTAPNSAIDLGGGAKLVINEQQAVPGADFGLTVNAVHLTAAAGLVDVVVGSATSDAHNCS
ncbi:sialidase family protein [Actinacidiphila soli]|uniref:sialidase family protein n=1 Tax=Actinacidiphila soli TaxID=2487275 RepID=UPI000FCABC0E|nr:sialidase family protein [Actinacidiphila soli]